VMRLKWKLISICLEIVLILTEDRCTVCAKHTIGSGITLTKQMVLLGDTYKWKLILVRLEIMLILMQDWCTICAERTIGSKIILDAPDITPRLRGSCEISFQSVWRRF
jgi:hypothetical protein